MGLFRRGPTNESKDKGEAPKDDARKPAITRNKVMKNWMVLSGFHGYPKEDAVEEKHDPFSNLKIHSNLELYFRERVFCSKTKRSRELRI